MLILFHVWVFCATQETVDSIKECCFKAFLPPQSATFGQIAISFEEIGHSHSTHLLTALGLQHNTE